MPALTAANDIIRARNVTASECYALLGKHPYATKQGIFDRLTTPWEYGHPEQSEAMRIGSYLEPHVARYAAQRIGVRVRAFTRTIQHPTVSLCATPDYYVLGHDYLMEIKVSSITYGWTADDLHPHYEYQARAQMACTGRNAVIIVALVGSAYHQVEVLRDLDKERRLLSAVDEFMEEHVLPGIRPENNPTPLTAVVMEKM